MKIRKYRVFVCFEYAQNRIKIKISYIEKQVGGGKKQTTWNMRKKSHGDLLSFTDV